MPDGMNGAVWILSFATVLQAILFAALLVHPRNFEDYSKRILIVLLAVFAIEKGDQIFLTSGAVLDHPGFAMIGNLFGALIAPLTYFHIRARTDTEFRIGWPNGWAFIPFAILIIYAIATYHRLGETEQLELLTSGQILNSINTMVIPLLGDAISFGFLVAAIFTLRQHDMKVRNWFASIDNRTLSGLRTILMLLAGMILIHFIWTLTGAGSVAVLLNFSHFLMINALAIGALTAVRDTADAVAASGSRERREATPEQITILECARTALRDQSLFQDADLTIARLARRLSVPQRQLSEAINLAGKMNFHGFVNEVRIEAAGRKLKDHPGQTILEIAYECGFNSKSTFNDAFRKLTGQTPSEYRGAS
ncbi:MAG: hypothetical protein DHS20C06_14660 [Hyphobacterium sp.]|nr:MAG: hypothetical protein DHS20C06_14660 [Hyphobacterium sp.]